MKKNIMKIFLSTMILSSLCVNTTYAFVKTDVNIIVNDMMQPLASSVINKDGHTLVSFRELFKMLDISVDWNGVKREITAKKDDITLIINVDTNIATINGVRKNMPIDVEIIDGTAYVPLRFSCEAFNLGVKWQEIDKKILIKNEKDEYIFLDKILKKEKNNIDDIDYKNAVDKAIDSSLEITKNKEELQLSEERLKKNMAILSDSIGYVGIEDYYSQKISVLKNKQNVSDIKEKKKIIIDNIEWSLISNIASIKKIKLDISVFEENMEITKKEVKIAKTKYKYGLISKNSLETVENSIKENDEELKRLNAQLEREEKKLREMLKQDKNVEINVNFGAKFSDIDEIDIDNYVLQEPEGNITIHMLEKGIELERKIEREYTYNRDSIGEIEDSQQIKAMQRNLEDTKERMREKIKENYKELKSKQSENENLIKNLKKMISAYNIVAANYISGDATELELEKAKLDILKNEKNIEENKIMLNVSLYKFFKPHL